MLNRLNKNLILAFTGIQETVLAIADRVNRRVQEAKNSIEAAELEKRSRSDEALLGMEVHRQPDLTLHFLSKDPELKSLYERIREDQRKLSALENQPPSQEALNDFERTLLYENFLIRDFIISEGFHGIGKRIRDIAPPLEMRIVLIQKKGRMIPAHGAVVLEPGDRVVFICPRENSMEYLSHWI